MNGPKKSMVVTFLAVATVLCPRILSAMDIQMFDQMAIQDQKDYVKFLLKDAQKILIEQDQRDQTAKVQELFQKILPGEHRSLGEAQFDETLAKARAFNADERPRKYPILPPMDVETVLVVTLNKNGIQTSVQFSRSLAQVIREKPFWPKRPLRTNGFSN
jgi:hypothetical protein